MYTTIVPCKECGICFETSTDEIGNPVNEVCNCCEIDESLIEYEEQKGAK
jgi:hypothetical protein